MTDKKLAHLVYKAKRANDVYEFVADSIFVYSISGVVQAIIEKNYKGDIFADKLHDFYNQVIN